MSERLLAALGVPDIARYWEALGRFVSQFSAVEMEMHTTLWHFAGISAPVAPALLSGVRVDGAISLINRIADAQQWGDQCKKECEYIFGQLGTINKARNELLHYGAHYEGPDDWTISNRLLAHTEEKIQTTKISAPILDGMTQDLLKIEMHLLTMTRGGPIPSSVDRLLKSAWRYKPQRQAGSPRKNRVRPPKRERQRRPSRH